MLTTWSYQLVFTALTLILSACYVPTGAATNEMVANKCNGTDVNAAGERIVSSKITLPQDCPGENYSPCSCVNTSAGFYVTCVRRSYEEVKAALSQSSTRILYRLQTLTSDYNVPEDITGGVLIYRIDITCVPEVRPMLTCSPKAFTSTEAFTRVFSLAGWDLSAHDYTYVENFNRIQYLFISFSDGFFDSWHRLPPLRSLNGMDVFNCKVTGVIKLFPPMQRSLKELVFTEDLLDDTSVASILDWLLSSPSNSTVWNIDFSMNQLTVIPLQLSLFPRLHGSYMADNFIKRLPADSFNFHPSTAIQTVDLKNCLVEMIEPGAFAGDLGNVQIYLNYNRLSRFEETVFQDILQQMAVEGKNGFIDLTSNPIDCVTDQCHLEWLVVTNRALLQFVQNGKCSNGTRFEDLDSTAIWRACSKELTSTEPTREQTTSAITTSVTTPQMTDETAKVKTETKSRATTSPSHVTPHYSTPSSTMTVEVDENVTSYITSFTPTMTNQNTTSVSTSGSSFAQYSTVLLLLLLVFWMLIFAAGA